ncbi:hypothetical protein EUX58_23710 [Pseudomonas sp. 770NI]|nr:hypothetical protein EUX58_23710 [Pseudomonas sp. 770NI]
MESISCGSWLACDGGRPVAKCAGWQTAIAGKPAPTLLRTISNCTGRYPAPCAIPAGDPPPHPRPSGGGCRPGGYSHR